MRNKQWIKAGLLTATLIGLAAPALAQHDDNGDGQGWRNRGGEQRGGGEARGRPGNGGGEARGRPDNNGGDRGLGWNRQQSAAPAMQAPPPQRDYPLRPAPPQVRGVVPAAPPPPPAVAAPRNDAFGQARANGGWQNGGDRDRRDNNRGDGGDWRNRNNGGTGWQNRDNRDNGRPDWQNRDNRGNDWRDRDRNDRDRDRDSWRRDRDDNNRDRDWRGNNRPPVVGRPPVTNRWQGYRPWTNDWRRDRRYDWQYWRNSHRDIFRLPNYYAPYGWSRGYFRFSIGAYLDELLFGSSYWIDDPWRYHLPPVYGSLRWVRYYDDALLIDIRDGYVVDIVYDVFW